jgi:hypothetical protein
MPPSLISYPYACSDRGTIIKTEGPSSGYVETVRRTPGPPPYDSTITHNSVGRFTRRSGSPAYSSNFTHRLTSTTLPNTDRRLFPLLASRLALKSYPSAPTADGQISGRVAEDSPSRAEGHVATAYSTARVSEESEKLVEDAEVIRGSQSH